MKMLKIKSCSDPMMWYSDKVGGTFSLIGEMKGEGYATREPDGYINVVRYDDAEIVEVIRCKDGVTPRS